MTLEEAKTALVDLSPAELRRVASRFAFELTVAARDTYEAGGSDVADPKRLRRYNETLHRVSAAALDADEGRTDEALQTLLAQLEAAQAPASSEPDIEAALDRSLASVAAPH